MSKQQATQGTKFRASNADRYINCAASVVAAQDEPVGPSGTHADRGTVAHKVGELCIMLGGNAKDHIGTKPCADEGIDIMFTNEMVEAVQDYIDYVRGLALDHVECELKVTMPWVPNAHKKKTTGFIDTIGYDDDFKILYIIDYKNGVMPVPADSLQFPTYAIPALQQYKDAESVVTVCVQPNSNDGEPIKEKVWTLQEVKELKKKIIEKVEWVNVTDPIDLDREDYKEGHWCKFCPNKHQCPLLGDKLFDALPSAADGDAMKSVKPVSKLDDKVVADIVRNGKKIKEFIEEVIKNATAKAHDGQAVAGTKLVEGRRSNRTWSVAFSEEMVAEIARSSGLSDSDIYKTTTKLITPAQLEKKMGKNKNLIQPMILPGVPAVTLVDIDDPRPSVESADDFDDYSSTSSTSNNDF